MAEQDQQHSSEQRFKNTLALKHKNEKKRKNANKNIAPDLAGPGALVNLEKNYDPEADRGVVTNRTHTWMVELPTEHLGNEKDGPLCGRVRDGGNIYVQPSDATCKRCINIYKRMKKSNKKMQPIKPNIQPKIEENIKRIISAAILSMYQENNSTPKIRGTKIELNAIVEALKATRNLQTVLQNSSVLAENIVTAVVQKKLAEKSFRKAFGFKWPL